MGFLKLFKKKEGGEALDMPPPPPLPPKSVLKKKDKKKEKKVREGLPPLPPLEPIVPKHREMHKEPTGAPVHPGVGQPHVLPPYPHGLRHPPAPSKFEAQQFPAMPDTEHEERHVPMAHRPRPVHPIGHRMAPHHTVERKHGLFTAPKHTMPKEHMPMPVHEEEEHKPFVPPLRREEDVAERKVSGPLFVKQDSYRSILEGISIIKDKLKQSEDLVLNLNNIKNSKDKEFERWRTSLEDMQRKLIYVDKILYEK
ncbi:MAG: hypothetical protein QF362_01455 [Candidatus Woesearchaeota archaeon]|jgi:hypothetical protein|nr:hypothetical protein [Candidatus Woesearchaeota archaeon]MDP7506090.1 hypothetical protein [Candidatus Woesearchaeota archaeon]MDP7610559.1 hypothetical protein [Candidatus Woesearchaeota archaeon]|tara:strand:+ start:222 stop:983 length:762 start_codon:yes stop_codon:yes gene_type:complete